VATVSKARSTQPTAVQTENNKNVKSKLGLPQGQSVDTIFFVIRQILKREIVNTLDF